MQEYGKFEINAIELGEIMKIVKKNKLKLTNGEASALQHINAKLRELSDCIRIRIHA